jgi:peptidoglycan/LPS O-acetylase OafA/YrhL
VSGTGPARPAEIVAFTGLRGVAATSVFLAHASLHSLTTPYLKILYWHDAAVDLFFCLSAFTLCLVYQNRRFSFHDYMAARIARIYPAYLAALAVALVQVLVFWQSWWVDYLGYAPRIAAIDFVLQLFMISDWPVIGRGVQWDFPAWSVSVEFFCYLTIFPLLRAATPGFARWSTTARGCFALCAMAASLAIYVADAHPRFHGRVGAETPGFLTLAFVPFWTDLLRGICGFCAGWAVWHSFHQQDGLASFCRRHADAIGGLAILAIVASRYNDDWKQSCILAFPFLVLGVSGGRSLAARILGTPVVHFLGLISYSLYIWHALVLSILSCLGVVWVGRPGTAMLVYAGILLIAWLSYRLIEVPARSWLRGLLFSRLSVQPKAV